MGGKPNKSLLKILMLSKNSWIMRETRPLGASAGQVAGAAYKCSHLQCNVILLNLNKLP
jgi:hypothetical protein